MSGPLLSVIIPTFKRGAQLVDSIQSALASGCDGEVEVVVVPNGSDDSWLKAAEVYRKDARVKWFPLKEAGAPRARNYGLKQAAGKYVRFLDDDDLLFAQVCKFQIHLMECEGLDVCSGAIDVVCNGSLVKTLSQPDVDDIVVSVFSPSRMTAVHAHLYRREFILGIEWEEDLPVRQDVIWFMRVASVSGVRWRRLEGSLGVWIQHSGERVSRGRDPGSRSLVHTAETIIELANALEADGRLSTARRVAASDGLWACIQKGLRYDFSYWVGVSETAEKYAVGRRPPSKLQCCRFLKRVPPLYVEVLLIPVRWIYHPLRVFLNGLGINRV